MFGIPDNGPVPTFANDADKFKWQYDQMLSSHLATVNMWADLSMKFKDGLILADELIEQFDMIVAKKAFILLLLDEIRKAQAEGTINSEVAKFAEQLDRLPGTEEK